ncbi:14055_t:CDS:1, partial [Funneliformis mosseae]
YCDVIKICQYDKAKDVRAVMFDIFGKVNLTYINTIAGVDDI